MTVLSKTDINVTRRRQDRAYLQEVGGPESYQVSDVVGRCKATVCGCVGPPPTSDVSVPAARCFSPAFLRTQDATEFDDVTQNANLALASSPFLMGDVLAKYAGNATCTSNTVRQVQRSGPILWKRHYMVHSDPYHLVSLHSPCESLQTQTPSVWGSYLSSAPPFLGQFPTAQ